MRLTYVDVTALNIAKRISIGYAPPFSMEDCQYANGNPGMAPTSPES